MVIIFYKKLFDPHVVILNSIMWWFITKQRFVVGTDVFSETQHLLVRVIVA